MSVALCLTLGVMIVGIYSATSGSSTLSSFVKWNAIGVDAEINGRVSGNKSSDNITNSYRQVISADDTNPSGTWSIGSMNFDTYNNASLGKKSCTPIVMRFSIKNTSSNEETKLYYKFSTQPQSIVNVDYTYRIAYGTLGSGETWNVTDFFSSSYSGNMTVVDNQKSCSAVEKYSLSDYIDNGETAVFEISMVVNNFTTNISSASLTPVLTLKSSLPPTLDALTFTASSDGNSYSVKASSSASGEVIIPSTYEGKPVTSIANNGFAYNSILTTVIIPDSVTTIGDSAFTGSWNIKSVIIPDSVTSLGNNAFSDCSYLENVKLSNNISKLGYNMFSQCESLSSITLPENITEIGARAFEGCKSLTSLRIPASVTSIGQGITSGCSSLTSLVVDSGNTTYSSPNNCNAILNGGYVLIAGCNSTVIPSGVDIIAEDAFRGSGIENITFPDSVTEIRDSAFYYCTNLKELVIPKKLTNIGTNTFGNCSGLASIKVDSGNTTYDSRDNCNALIKTASNSLILGCNTTIIPNSVTSIGASAFYSCSGLKNITIPDSVTSIGNYAFYGCSVLTNVTLGNGLISIGSSAFQSCAKLTSITIPDNVTSIMEHAFSECGGMTNVTLGNGLTSIGSSAFSYCKKLTKIFIPASVTTITATSYYSSPFNSCSSSLVIYCVADSKPTGWGTYWNYYASGKTLTVNWNASQADLYSDILTFTASSDGNSYSVKGTSTASGEVIIPSRYEGKPVTSIEDFAFQNGNITSVIISNTVTSIGYRAFAGCNRLTSMVIPNSVVSIGVFAFYGCSGLTSITIPDSVTSIGGYAFYYCSGLTSITIPNNVTSIGDYAFYGCSGLTSITIGNSVTSIGGSAFFNCIKLTKIFIPASVTNISASSYSDSPFNGCSSSLVIYCEAGSKPTGWGTYWNYYSSSGTLTVNWGVDYDDYNGTSKATLDKLTFTLNSTTNTYSVKALNTSIQGDVIIPSLYNGKTVDSIDANGFKGCTGITGVVLPNSMKTINDSAFFQCTNLIYVYTNQGLESIAAHAFAYTNLSSIFIPKTVTAINGTNWDCPFYGVVGQSLLVYFELSQTSATSAGIAGTNGNWDYINIDTDNTDAIVYCSSTYGCTEASMYSGLTFTLNSDNTYSVKAKSTSAVIKSIPYKYEGKYVTRIEDEAFKGNQSVLSNFRIPSTITYIGKNAFMNFTKLYSIFIPSSVVTIVSDSATDSAFYGCSSSLKINCEASSKPNGWGSYWNYRTASATCTTNWSKTS